MLRNMSKFQNAKPKKPAFGTGSDVVTPDPDRLPPIFSFEYMRAGDGYSVDCCNADHRSALASRLFKLTQMTWMQIRNAPRHGLGSETIAKDSIKPSLPPAVTEDVTLLALRYNGLHPMVGYRNGRTFHILFLDHSMDCYPHE